MVGHSSNLDVVAILAGCVVVWDLLSARLLAWNISAPIAFVAFGLVTANGPTAIVHLRLHSSAILQLAELTLALVLFSDATRVNLRALRGQVAVPARLLGLGLPMAIAAGTGIAFGVLGGSLWVAAVIGAVMAPTDAALGAQIIADDRIPAFVRRTLNVESGLNDGIATPFVNIFLAGAVAAELPTAAGGVGGAVVDLFGGAGIGVAVGIVGAVLMAWSRRIGLGSDQFEPLTGLALALLAYSTAVLAGTNGFVAAFVSGMAFGAVRAPLILGSPGRADRTPPPPRDLRFLEDVGELMSLVVWYVFGAAMLVPGFEASNWNDVVFAVLVLTAGRMVPTALALIGTGIDRSTVAFMGWFGPRGLASVVFGLIAVDQLDQNAAHLVVAAVVLPVTLSVLAHGLTAGPLARAYSNRAALLPPDAPEQRETESVRVRAPRGTRRAGQGAGQTDPENR